MNIPLIIPDWRQGWSIALLLVVAMLPQPLRSAPAYCETRLAGHEGRGNDQFGLAVAVDGDIIAVGAPYADDSAVDQGVVYVYRRTESAWAQVARLTASSGGQGDGFGAALAIRDGLLVIGAPFTSRGLLRDMGTVYVYEQLAGEWQEVARLAPPLQVPLGLFGFSVDTAGGVIVVGAPGTAGVGAAYVFARSDGAWAQVAVLAPSTPAVAGFFGDAVKLHGDMVAVGAPGYPGSGLRGAVDLFESPWVTGLALATLTASDGEAEDFFGDAIAMHDDVIIVGAEGDDDGATDAGAAYVFVRPADGWAAAAAYAAKLIAPDPTRDGELADSIAFDGQILVLSAEGDDHAGPRSGAAYLYLPGVDGWQSPARPVKLTAANIFRHDQFGQSVAMSGQTIVIGAPGSRAGVALVYSPCPGS